MTAIDLETGLPEVPSDMFWDIRENYTWISGPFNSAPRPNGSHIELALVRQRQRIDVEFTTYRRPKAEREGFRRWKTTKEVTQRETMGHARLTQFDSETIRSVAAGILSTWTATEKEKARIREIKGTYPPKKLED